MKNKRFIVLFTLLTLVVSTAAFADTANCVRSASNARIEWQGDAPAGTSVRAYFRSANAKAEHYVDMTREGDGFWAVLPKTADSAAAVEYRIATVADGKETTQTQKTLVVSPTCKTADLSVAQARATGRIIVGATKAAPSFPVGFRCEGIAGRITAEGVLVTERACPQQTVATAGLVHENSAARTTTATTTTAAATSAGSRNEKVLTSSVISDAHLLLPRQAVIDTPPDRKQRNPPPTPPGNPISPKR